MIASTVFPVISDGGFGVVETAAEVLELVPLLEATTRDDVWGAVAVGVKVPEAAELEEENPNAGAAVDCAWEDEAGAAGLVDKENPVKELVVPAEAEAAVVLATPNPAKELRLLDEEPVEATGAVVTAAEELRLKEGMDGAEAPEEALAVVAVENNGVDEAVDFVVAAEEATLPRTEEGCEAEEEANENEKLDVVAGVADAEVGVLFKIEEVPAKENAEVGAAELDGAAACAPNRDDPVEGVAGA